MKNLDGSQAKNSIQIMDNSERNVLLGQREPNRQTEIPMGHRPTENGLDATEYSAKAEKMLQARFIDLFHFVEGGEKVVLWLAIIISVAQGTALPLMTLIVGDLTNSFTPDKTAQQTEELVATQLLNMVYIGIAVLVAAFVASIMWNFLSARQAKKIKLIYFKKLLDQNSAWYDKTKIDQLSANFIDQVSSFTAVFSAKMHLIFMNYSTAISGIVIGFVKGWLLTLFVLLLIPIAFFGMFFFIKAIQKSEEIQRTSYAQAGSTSDECFTFIKTVKSLNGEEHEIKRYAGHCEDSKQTSIKFGYKAGLLWGIFFFSGIFMYGMGYLIGSRMISDDWINNNYGRVYNVGDVLTIFPAVMTGIFSLGNLGPLQKAMEAAKVAIAMILKIIKDDQGEKYGTYKPETISGNFVFENVSFAYPSNPSVVVLKNVNFTIKPGQKVAFVGPSGSGKSTIVQLIERFYDPTEGRILLDGVDLKEYDIDYLRQKIGLVSQQPILFADSIRYNILLGMNDQDKVTEEQIWKALDEAVASEFVRKFNNQLNEFVGSQGGQLSGGQKQRIAIARALIRTPKFFLFDEATSALDRKNEMEIQKTLDKIAQSTTSLTIAHRLSTIINSDNIFVLHNGVLEQHGTHNDLMKDQSGTYFKLVEHQITGENIEDEPEEDNEAVDAEDQELARVFAANKDHSGFINQSQSMDFAQNLGKASSQKFESKNSKQISLGPKQSSYNDSQSQIEVQTEAPPKKKLKLSNFMGKEKSLIGVGVIVAACQGAITPVIGYILGSIIELLGKLEMFKFPDLLSNITYTKSDVLHEIDLLIIAFVVVAVGSFIFSSLQFAVFNQIGEMFTYTIRIKYFRRLMYKDLTYFDKEENQPGAISSRLALDCKTINILIGTYIGSIFQSLSSLIVGLVIAFIYSWRIALVMMAMTPLLFICGIVDTQMINAEKKAENIQGSGLLPEALNNMKVVRSLTAQHQIFSRFERFAESQRVTSLKKSWIMGFLFGFSQFSQVLIYAVIFRVGSKFQIDYGLNTNEFFIALFAGYGAGMANQFFGGIGEAKGAADKILTEINSDSKIEVDP
jgi:ATP-binding cassette subfamily B (MDR/TAP) protein 1